MAAAGPQLEDGYTRIANELLEAILIFGFTNREAHVLLTIIRKTYGYGKKEDDISASQIGDMCGLARPHVTATLNSLALRNVITKRSGRFGSVIGIQKNHRKWVRTAPGNPVAASTDLVRGCTDLVLVNTGELSSTDSTESVQGSTDSVHVPNQYPTSTESVQVASTKSVHTKENLPKETQKKGSRPEISFAKWIEQCEQEGVKPITENDPIFGYATELGLPIDFIRYAWVEFKRKYGKSRKKYKLWNQHFGNAVRENWYGVWFEKNGDWQLTTRGKQIEKELKAKQ